MPTPRRLIAHDEHHRDEDLLSVLKICQKMNAEWSLAALLDLIAREAAEAEPGVNLDSIEEVVGDFRLDGEGPLQSLPRFVLRLPD